MDNKRKLLLGLSRRLDLPAEVLVGDPCVELKGNSELVVLRHRGLVAYESDCIGVGTSLGVLRVRGAGLSVFRMNRERVVIYGRIDALLWKEDDG